MPGRFLRPRWWTRTPVLAAAYLLAIHAGRALLVQPEQLAILWPATGLALAALVARPRSSWPGLLIALFLVHVLAERVAGFPWTFAIGIPATVLAEIAITAALVKRLAYRDGEFTRWTMTVLTVAMALTAAAFAFAAAALMTGTTGASPGRIWLLWWSTETLSAVLVTPAVLLAPSLARWWRHATAARRVETVSYALCLAAVALGMFALPSPRTGVAIAAVALPYPLLVLLGARSGPGAVAWATLPVSIVAALLTRDGLGPFAAIEPDRVYQVLPLQAYLAILVGPSVLLALLAREASEAAGELRDVVDHASDAVFVVDVDEDGTFRYRRNNRKSEQLTGFTTAQIAGRTPHELLPESMATAIVERYRRAVEQRTPLTYEETLTLGGTTRTWVGTLVPIVQDGTVIRIAGFARDVTEQRQHEAIRAALEAQLRQAQKMDAIGRLAGGLAHDFNNILTAIIGHAELLADRLASERDARESVGAILEAGRRASLLVAQVLTFARRREQERVPVSLASVLSEVLRLARATVPSTIEVRTELDPECPRVVADPTQIHQALMNLVSNAAYAMRARGGTLTIALDRCVIDEDFARGHASLSPGPAVCLTVTDTGEGMDPDTLEHIYEPFFTTKPIGEGTGLGIPVVLGIVQQHDGGILIESVRGRGTSVRIFLPAVLSDDAVAPTPRTTVTPPGRGQRILLVDDEAAVADVGARLLESLGYHVVLHTDPDEAAAYFLANRNAVDALVTDLTMPGMTGTTLLGHLRRYRPDLPVVIATGVTSAIAAGQDDAVVVLAKPYTRHALGVAVAGCLEAAARVE